MKKSARQRAEVDKRINIQLREVDEQETFRQLKMLAAASGESMKDIVVRSVKRTVSEELPPLLKKDHH